MSVSVIPPISTATALRPLAAVGSTGGTSSSGADFAAQIANGLNSLQNAQAKADDLAIQAATGSLTDVHQYLVAATEASLATKLTVAVRNKALDAFNEIMRMQA